MRRFSYVLVAGLLCGLAAAGCGKRWTYTQAEFDSTDKIRAASADWIGLHGDPKALQQFDVRKVAIVEFYVDYLQSRQVQESVFSERRTAEAAAANNQVFYTPATRTTSIRLGEMYYVDLTNALHDLVARHLAQAGFEVVPKETIAGHPAYRGMELEGRYETNSYQGGMFKERVSTSSLKLSATDLGMWPSRASEGESNIFKVFGSAFKEVGKANTMRSGEYDLATGLGAALVHVGIFVDKDDNGKPVIRSFNLHWDLDPVQERDMKIMRRPMAVHTALNKPMPSGAEIGGEGGVNLEAYTATMTEMVDTLAAMIAARIEGGLGYLKN